MHKAYPVMIISMIAAFVLGRILAKDDGIDDGHDAANAGKKTTRETADDERRKLMSELGKKGAAKRWNKDQEQEGE